MLITALVFAGIAALIHVYIFVLESLRWTADSTRKTFGTTAAEAETTRSLAFNQGFYNLSLALVTVVGIGLLAVAAGVTVMDPAAVNTSAVAGLAAGTSDGLAAAGSALLIAGTGSMLLAALVLLASNRRMLRAALIQGTTPALALLFLLLAAIAG